MQYELEITWVDVIDNRIQFNWSGVEWCWEHSIATWNSSLTTSMCSSDISIPQSFPTWFSGNRKMTGDDGTPVGRSLFAFFHPHCCSRQFAWIVIIFQFRKFIIPGSPPWRIYPVKKVCPHPQAIRCKNFCPLSQKSPSLQNTFIKINFLPAAHSWA